MYNDTKTADNKTSILMLLTPLFDGKARPFVWWNFLGDISHCRKKHFTQSETHSYTS